MFGPGFGECVVLHMGDGNWAVIDSCLDVASKRPAALAYLDRIGADATKSVQLVVATHWHDDHIQGISEVFQTAVNSVFACSGAVQPPALNEVLSRWMGTRFLAGGSGIDELHGVMAELKKRSADSRYVTPRLATVGKTLWPITGKPNSMGMIIKSLSPSDAAVLVAIGRLEGVLSASNNRRLRLPNLQQNDTSVVMSVEAGGHRVLLGGDLHVRGDRSFGWLAIVDDHAGADARHHGFKVGHHGSQSSYHEELWGKLLVEQPFAVTTPFVGGKVRLPSVSDCERILAKTKNAYLTAPPLPAKFRDANRAVERTVEEATLSVQMVPGKYGHVRLRKNVEKPLTAPWRVELFGAAISMEDYVRSMNVS